MPAQNRQYLLSFVATIKGNKMVVNNLKQMEGHLNQTAKGAKTGVRHTNDFVKALRRVAIVVPMWFLFRQTMMLVIQTIQDATKHYVEFEDALAKAAAVTSNAGMEMGQAMNVVRGISEDFARTHRGTANDVAEAYYRMATSGLDFKDAIEGAVPAVKLAIGSYGDITATAKTVSAIYRLLGNNIQGVTTDQEKMIKIVDVLGRAWQNHEVELNEISQAIANVGGQAASFGITMTELVAVLSVSSDALLKSGRAGRLFGRSLDEMARKLPQVEKFLGEAFDPTKPLDWFQILLKIVGKLSSMGRTTAQIEQALSEMFGIRSTRFIRAIVVQYDKLTATLDDLQNNSEGTVEALLKLRDATPATQIENLRENIAFLGKDFLTGITSSEDFVIALQKINDNLSGMGLNAMTAGAGIAGLFKNIRALFRVFLDAPKDIKTFFGDIFALPEQITTGQFGGEELKNLIVDSYKAAFAPVTGIGRFVEGLTDIGKFGAVDIEKEMLDAAKRFLEIEKNRVEQRKLSKEEETIKIRQQLEDQLGGGEELVDLENKKLKALYDALKLQQDITEEMKEQRDLSSDSVKIYQAYERFGFTAAKQFAEVLEGIKTFRSLSRRREVQFRTLFSGRAEEFEAQRFFFETKAGAQIPIPERREAEERRLKLQERLIQLAPKIPVEFKQEIKVSLDSEKISERIKEAITKELEKQNYSNLVREINNKIEEY